MAEQIARIRLIHTAKVGEKFEIASVRAMGSLTGRGIARSSKGGHTLRSASPPRDNMDGIHLWWRENLRVAKMVCVYDEPDGRGNLRVAKTPPLQSALAGMLLLVALGVVDKINVFCGGLPMQGRGAPRRYKNGGDHALNREGGLIHRDAGNS